jgi:hypothetical protein
MNLSSQDSLSDNAPQPGPVAFPDIDPALDTGELYFIAFHLYNASERDDK